MHPIDVVRLAAASALQAPLRAVLSIISFIVGVAVPVFVFGISQGMKDQIAELGTEEFRRKLNIYRSFEEDSQFAPRLSDIDTIKSSSLPFTAIGAIESWPRSDIEIFGDMFRARVDGITNEALVALTQPAIIGVRDFPGASVAGVPPCIINQRFYEELGFSELPHRMQVSGQECRIIGVVGPEPYAPNNSNIVYLPIDIARGHFRSVADLERSGSGVFSSLNHSDQVSRIAVLFSNFSDMERSEPMLREIINRTRIDRLQNITEANTYFYPFDNQRYEATKRNLDGFLAIIMVTIVSFVILNVGLNSYYAIKAKIDEIAVQIALGASSTEIVIVTIAETMIYVLIGGVFGALLALQVASPLNSSTDFRIVTDFGVVVRSLVLLALSGLAAAAFPAWFASRIDPSSALKR